MAEGDLLGAPRTVWRMSEDIDGVAQQAPAKKLSATLWLFAGTVALCLVAGVAAAFRSNSTGSDPGADAERVCQEEFIPKRLKAPATAEFSDVAVTSSGDVYTVTGSVDSQNSFGALVRATFSCVVRSSGDQWVLQSASVNG